MVCKKIIFIGLLLFAFSFLLTGCDSSFAANGGQTDSKPLDSAKVSHSTNEGISMAQNIHIKIKGQTFTIKMENNPTTEAFVKKLPLTLSMKELNGNEKYARLSFNLPSQDENPRQIHTGDLMLYDSDCVVLFYKDFSTNYSYTQLGRIDEPEKLAELVGSGNITATFEP